MTYLKNTWYVAANGHEIDAGCDGALFHRQLLGRHIVFYRKADGAVAALEDRCPHRFAPLHMGRVIGDTLQCGYHGLRYDCSGVCVENPHGNKRIPKAAVVPGFIVHERYGLVWIWFGAPELADPSLIADFSFLQDDARSVVSGYHRVACHYELLSDNLADLSHIQFVHAGYHQIDDLDTARYVAEQTGTTVENKYFFPNARVTALWGKYLGDPDLVVDRWTEAKWDAPSLFTISAGVTRPGDSRKNKLGSLLAAHLLTPETEISTHYFYAHSRDYKVGDVQTDAVVREWQKVGFREQDQPMLEAVQLRMGASDLMSLNPVLLPTDAGALRIRRTLAKLIDSERAPALHALGRA